METFFVLGHPVTILVTALTNPNNLTNDLLILKLLFNSYSVSFYIPIKLLEVTQLVPSFTPCI